MKTIKLTPVHSTIKMSVNMDNVEEIECNGRGNTTLSFVSGRQKTYKETPEEIDRLLGIEETEAKPITKILTCKSCVGWVVFNSEKGCPECVNGSMFEENPF